MRMPAAQQAAVARWQAGASHGCRVSSLGPGAPDISLICRTPDPWRLLQAFYADFARVADDESRHFGWCQQRLKELGFSYGCMVAHSILWDGAVASAGVWPLLARDCAGPQRQLHCSHCTSKIAKDHPCLCLKSVIDLYRTHVCRGPAWATGRGAHESGGSRPGRWAAPAGSPGGVGR